MPIENIEILPNIIQIHTLKIGSELTNIARSGACKTDRLKAVAVK